MELLSTQNRLDILILDAALRKTKKFSGKFEKIQHTSEVVEVLETISQEEKEKYSLPAEWVEFLSYLVVNILSWHWPESMTLKILDFVHNS